MTLFEALRSQIDDIEQVLDEKNDIINELKESSDSEDNENEKRIVELEEMVDGRERRILELEDEVRDLRQSLAECEEPA